MQYRQRGGVFNTCNAVKGGGIYHLQDIQSEVINHLYIRTDYLVVMQTMYLFFVTQNKFESCHDMQYDRIYCLPCRLKDSVVDPYPDPVTNF